MQKVADLGVIQEGELPWYAELIKRGHYSGNVISHPNFNLTSFHVT